MLPFILIYLSPSENLDSLIPPAFIGYTILVRGSIQGTALWTIYSPGSPSVEKEVIACLRVSFPTW